MKKKFTFYFAMLMISIVVFKQSSCNSDATGQYAKSPPKKRTFLDTAKVIGVFVSPDGKSVLHDIVYKLRFDSAQIEIPTGENSFKKVWGIDSIVFIPRLDTLRDSTGVVLRDEKGNARFNLNYIQARNDLVWVSSLNVDSAVKRFQKFLITDTARKK